ncbi:hypothetical protein DRJ17_06310 [Candidatus Woesearchaeota archaeon]|nr:MAG: hypothetical protein DRJ17_06310 [Candidatus Woesearchaeota archaeon]
MVNENRKKTKEQLISEIATPVIILWQDILAIPIVGTVDSKRAQQITEVILNKILVTQSKVIILDISGVPFVDTAVANHLLKISRAAKLMGCDCVISGMSPAIAQTLVRLGIDVGDIITTTSLKDALVLSFNKLGYEIKAKKK